MEGMVPSILTKVNGRNAFSREFIKVVFFCFFVFDAEGFRKHFRVKMSWATTMYFMGSFCTFMGEGYWVTWVVRLDANAFQLEYKNPMLERLFLHELPHTVKLLHKKLWLPESWIDRLNRPKSW